MDLKLRLGATERGECGDCDEHDSTLAESLRDRFIASRRAEAAAVFERGVERGELRSDLDVGVAIDALYGAVYYRLLVSHAPLDAAYSDTLIDQLFPAFEPRDECIHEDPSVFAADLRGLLSNRSRRHGGARETPQLDAGGVLPTPRGAGG